MPIVNRLLDAFFRTLDAVDMARERLDRALGRAPQPEQWATDWSPTPPAAKKPATVVPIREVPTAPTVDKARVEAPKGKSAPKKIRTAGRTGAPPKKSRPIKQGAAKRASRKGSIDRKGTDFDSPRARAVAERLANEHTQVVSAEATHDGKKVLARVLWALDAAERAGSELGLTAADASALLSMAAGLEAFATNIARACRDESDLILESTPDGRSKRYKLTAAGRAAAGKLELRAQ
ncbi:MAG: hypothetical protein HYS27_11580 [Deltaproteobacteria bacterium]|nr:hypothetical protein [Deltaproteobacteria bacterium]